MIKAPLIAIVLSVAAVASFAQASAPADSASAPVKHKWIKKLKNHKPGAPATNPEASPDKKGGQ
jgi:hypothetical protein